MAGDDVGAGDLAGRWAEVGRVTGSNGDGRRDWEMARYYFVQAREADEGGYAARCDGLLYLMNVALKRENGTTVHAEHLEA